MPKVLKTYENDVCDLILSLDKIKTEYEKCSDRIALVFIKMTDVYKLNGNEIIPDVEKRDIMYSTIDVLRKREKKLKILMRELKYNISKKEKYKIVVSELETLSITIRDKSLNFDEKFLFVLLGRCIEEKNIV